MCGCNRKLKQGLAFFLACLLCTSCGASPSTFFNGKGKIKLYSDTVYSAFALESSEVSDDKIDLQENSLDYVNYWVQSSNVIFKINKGQPSEDWKPILDCMLDTFDRTGSFPRPQYEQFEAGWVSSMDAPLIALASHLAYETTGEDRYKKSTRAIMNTISRSVEDGGFALYWEDNVWLLEYADKNISPESALYVLNGSLLGVLATKMLADTYKDKDLLELLEKQVATYVRMKDRFIYSDGSYCYYMLQPKAVNQPHYVIFEIRLLDAMAEVFSSFDAAFFREEAQRRRGLLLKMNPIYLSEQNNETMYTFMRGGSPHPYYIDIYSTKFQFLDSAGNLISETLQEGRNWFKENWMHDSLPIGTVKIRWTAVSAIWEVAIGDYNVKQLPKSKDSVLLPYTLEVTGDAFARADDPNTLVLNPSQSEQTRVSLHIAIPLVSAEVTDIFAIEIDYEEAESAPLSSNIILYNSQGIGISRYLKSVSKYKTVLLFSLNGFANQGEHTLKDVHQMVLRLYTNDLKPADHHLQLGNIYQFKSSVALMDYFNETEYTFMYGP